MAEQPVGTTNENFVSSHKTREGGSLSFAYSDKDFLANTVGHIFAIPAIHLPLLTFGDMLKNPDPGLVDKLRDRWKDVPWKGDVLVRVGHTSIMGDIQRLLASDEKVKGRAIFSTTHPVIDKVARILYVPFQVMKAVDNKWSRIDHYDAITNTVVAYHPNLAVGMHELGHAKFLENQKKKEGWVFFYPFPIIRSFMEWKASANAMKQFANDDERRAALKLLEPAFATSFVPDIFGLAGLTQIPGLELAIGTITAGHFMARAYPRRDQRFEYVFEGKNTQKPVRPSTVAEKPQKPPTMPKRIYDLKPHQILEAKARPFDSGGERNGKRPLHSNTSRVTF